MGKARHTPLSWTMRKDKKKGALVMVTSNDARVMREKTIENKFLVKIYIWSIFSLSFVILFLILFSCSIRS